MTAKIKLNAASGGGSISIQAPSSSSNNRVIALPDIADGTLVTSQSTLDATKLSGTLPAISGANLTGISSAGVNRNLIINGAMLVAQRGTSSTSTGYATVDRFEVRTSGTDENPTQAQVDVASGTTPYTSGFRKAYKITNGNQTSGAGAADQLYIRHRIESQDLANSGWNYVSSSSYVTLSFWVKSSVAQNFYGYLEAQQGTAKMFPFQTGSLSADTWTKVTVTISGNSDLTFANDNSVGMGIIIAPFFGTDNTDNSASVNTWKAHSSSARCPDNTSTWYTTNDATFELTGVQLELGQQATNFNHLSFGDNSAKCQRYYYKYPYTFYGFFGYGTNSGTNQMGNLIRPVEMRTTATVTMTTGSYWTYGPVAGGGGGYYSYAYGTTNSSNGANLLNYELSAEL